MPLYEYKCMSCGHKVEKLASLKKADYEQLCPVCRAWMKRQMGSIVHFVFKEKK